MKTFAWIWILALGVWILLFPPRLERYNETIARCIPAGHTSIFDFGNPIDVPALLITLIGVCSIPAVLIHYASPLNDWIRRRYLWLLGGVLAFSCIIGFLMWQEGKAQQAAAQNIFLKP